MSGRYLDGASVIIDYRHFHERVVDDNQRQSILRRENVYRGIINTRFSRASRACDGND